MKKMCNPIATLTLIGSLIGGANAAVVVSGNTADFILTPESFNAVIVATSSDISSISGNLTLVNAPGIGDPATGTHAYSNYSAALAGNEYAINGDENFDVHFATIQTTFAFSYDDDSVDSDFALEFFDGLTSVGTSSFSTMAPFDTANFIAFTSDAGFDRVTVRESDGPQNSNELFQFYSATAVPEPTTTLFSGLACLVFALRRSRR